jgi:glycine cleavage system H lipoate-binding protein
VLEINSGIEDHLEIVSRDWAHGWILRKRRERKSLDGLMDAAEYEKYLATLAH